MNDLLFPLLFGGIWGFVGLVFLLVGLFMNLFRKRKEKRCTAETVGRITALVANPGQGGLTQHPQVTYQIGMLTYEKISPFGSTNPRFAIGEQVTVYYDPNDPHVYCIKEWKAPRLLSLIFILVGVSCFAVALLGLFIPRFFSSRFFLR